MVERVRIALALLMLSGLASLGPTCSQEPGEAPEAAEATAEDAVVREVAVPGFTIRYEQVAWRRTGRTVFEYDYVMTLQNDTAAEVNVENARVQSVGPATTLVDDEVVFSSPILPGETLRKDADPFTIAQDRAALFDPENLLFSVFSGLVGACREKLFVDEDIVAADDLCALAVDADPEDGEARFLRAVTRLLRVSEEQVDGPASDRYTDSVKEMEDQFGLDPQGRTVYDWDASLARDMADDVILPPDSPTGPKLQTAIEDLLLPAIDASIADLQAFPEDDGFFLGRADVNTIGEAIGVTLDEEVEIDKGDARAIESALLLLKARLHELLAVQLLKDDAPQLVEPEELDIDETFSPLTQKIYCGDVLEDNPSLLTPDPFEGGTNLEAAKEAIRDAIHAYEQGSAFIRTEADDQDDDLFTIEPDQLLDEEEIRLHLDDLEASLDGPTCIFDQGTTDFIDEASWVENLNDALEPATLFEQAILDLSVVFDASYSLRAVTPNFHDGCGVASGDLPDKEFGGALVPAACGSP